MSEKIEYQVIYADPPWKYRELTTTKNRRIENHYPTMLLQDIKDMEIPSAKDSICYLWATSPKLKEALEVMEAWEFDYRSSLIWDKLTMGMGYWFRIQHELLLVGVKGSFPSPKPCQRIRSVVSMKKTKHSVKPDYIRRKISEWFPDASKIELFARDKFEGWATFGNEVSVVTQRRLFVK